MGYVRLLFSAMLVAALAACSSPPSEEDLIGTWRARYLMDDVEVAMYLDLQQNQRLQLHIRSASPKFSIDEKGTWSLRDGKLYILVDGDKPSQPDEVVKFEGDKLILRDQGLPGFPIVEWSRQRDEIPATIAETKGAARDSLPRVTLPSDNEGQAKAAGPAPEKPAAPNVAAAPVVPAPAPARPNQILDDYTLIESHDVKRYEITLGVRRNVQIVLDIEDNTPIDVMVLPASVASKYDNMKMAVAANEADRMIEFLGQMFGKEEADKFKTGSKFTEADFYNRPMARKAAHRHFETQGVLPAGEYVLFLDNSGDVSKTLGDASIRIQLVTSAAN